MKPGREEPLTKKSDLTVVRPSAPARPDAPRAVLPSSPTTPSLGQPPTPIAPTVPSASPALQSNRRAPASDLTTVRPLSAPPPAPRTQDLTRVRPAGMEIASPSTRTIPPAVPQSSRRVSIPPASEITRQTNRRSGGMLALYWAAGIVAMLTAGGIVTAMIARGDADALIQRQGSAPPAPIVITSPGTIAQPTLPVAPAVAETPPEQPKAQAAPAPPAKKDKVVSAIPGTKPGQIVDLQLWKNRTPGATSNSANGSATPSTSPGTTAPPSGNAANVHTPDNDPAVRLARDQLESTFK